MRFRRLAPILVSAAAMACGGSGSDDLPRGFALRPAPTSSDSTLACPNVAGAYWVQRHLIWNRLVQPFLTDEQRGLPWSVLSIRGDALEGLDLHLRTGDLVDSVRLTRGTHYECAAGWIVPHGEVWLRDLSDEDSSRYADDPKHNAFSLGIAADTSGTLIGRVRIHSWSQLDVWCGDGCKGFPLPWTVSDRVQWEYLGTTARPPLGVPDDDIGRKVAAEERALEMGEPDGRPPNLVRLVKAMMPPESDILAVTPEGAGFRLSVVVPKDTDMPDFIGRLINTQGLTGAHEVPLFGAWTMGERRRWQTVIWVPKP